MLRRHAAVAVPWLGAFAAILSIAALEPPFSSGDVGCCGPERLKMFHDLPTLRSDVLVSAHNYAGRVSFTTAAKLQVLLFIASFGTAMFIGWRSLAEWGRLRRVVILMTLVAAAVILAVTAVTPALTPTLARLIERTVVTDCKSVLGVHLLLDRMTFIAGFLFIAVGSFSLICPSGTLRNRLRRMAAQQHELNALLIVGTLFMAASIFRIAALSRWIESYAVTDDLAAGLRAVLGAILQTWGVYYSMFLAAIHVPCILLLRRRLQNAARAMNFETPPPWFDAQWLKVSLPQEIGRMAAILAPFIAGNSADLLTRALA